MSNDGQDFPDRKYSFPAPLHSDTRIFHIPAERIFQSKKRK
jgi:hypothetical protein